MIWKNQNITWNIMIWKNLIIWKNHDHMEKPEHHMEKPEHHIWIRTNLNIIMNPEKTYEDDQIDDIFKLILQAEKNKKIQD